MNSMLVTASTSTITPDHSSASSDPLKKDPSSSSAQRDDSYSLLADMLTPRLPTDPTKTDEEETSTKHRQVAKALRSLSSAQGALKTLDGAAFEAYQRTHSTDEKNADVTKVSGRVTRSAIRTGCAADAFFACELCDFIQRSAADVDDEIDALEDTLEESQLTVLLNVTRVNNPGGKKSIPPVSIMVLWDPHYNSGVGVNHGGMDALLQQQQQQQHARASNDSQSGYKSGARARGRILVLVMDDLSENLTDTLKCLDAVPHILSLDAGLVRLPNR